MFEAVNVENLYRRIWYKIVAGEIVIFIRAFGIDILRAKTIIEVLQIFNDL